MYNKIEREVRFIIKYKSGIIAYKDNFNYLSLPSVQEIVICNNHDLIFNEENIPEDLDTSSFIRRSINKITKTFTNIKNELNIDYLSFRHSSDLSLGFSRYKKGIHKYIHISLCSIDLSGLIDFGYLEKRLPSSKLDFYSKRDFINNIHLQEEMNVIPEHKHSLFKLENYLKSYQKELNEYLINNSLDIPE